MTSPLRPNGFHPTDVQKLTPEVNQNYLIQFETAFQTDLLKMMNEMFLSELNNRYEINEQIGNLNIRDENYSMKKIELMHEDLISSQTLEQIRQIMKILVEKLENKKYHF